MDFWRGQQKHTKTYKNAKTYTKTCNQTPTKRVLTMVFSWKNSSPAPSDGQLLFQPLGPPVQQGHRSTEGKQILGHVPHPRRGFPLGSGRVLVVVLWSKTTKPAGLKGFWNPGATPVPNGDKTEEEGNGVLVLVRKKHQEKNRCYKAWIGFLKNMI